MDYRKIYQALVANARNTVRVKHAGIYYEAHHILPKSFGGLGDCRNLKHPNIVLLTTKEHYMAHLLLTKIYPDSPAMHKALWNMCQVSSNGHERYKPGGRMYQFIRTDYIKNCSGENNHFFGKKHSDAVKEGSSLRNKGHKYGVGVVMSPEAIAKRVAKIIGRKTPEDVKAKLRLVCRGGKNYNAQTIKCSVTGKIYGSGRELSEELNIPFSTVRRWLNGTTPPPAHFHYAR